MRLGDFPVQFQISRTGDDEPIATFTVPVPILETQRGQATVETTVMLHCLADSLNEVADSMRRTLAEHETNA